MRRQISFAIVNKTETRLQIYSSVLIIRQSGAEDVPQEMEEYQNSYKAIVLVLRAWISL